MDTCHTFSEDLPSHLTASSHFRNNSFDRKPTAVCVGVTSHACSSKETLEKSSALVDNNGRPVVVLKVYRTPIYPAQLPAFYEDEEIVGNVELNLIKPENVEEIILSVRGTINGLSRHPKPFIELTERLWQASQVEQIACPNSWAGTHSAQLKGYFNWPFSMKLPTHVTAADALLCNATGDQFTGQLPPSFSVANSRSSITYEVTVNVKGRHNLTLSAPFIYTPTIRPPCLSSPRGLSCNQSVDEDQWEVFRSFVIRGIAFAAYNVDVSCTFALAKPLHYTRGTSILCALALESVDANVIELLASARAPCVQLSRQLEDANSGLETKIVRLWDAIRQPSAFVSSATWYVAGGIDEQNDELLAAVSAVKSSLRGGGMHSRILIGKIPLAADLTPSFSFAKIAVQYEIQMLPFKAAGFVPSDGDRAIFFRTNVQIASAPAIPASSRPGSTASSRPNSLHRHMYRQPAPQPRRDASPRSSPGRDLHLDRPLPSLPSLPTCQQREYLRRPERSDSFESSESQCIALRRAATAPRVPPSPRPVFPSRQCTR